MTSPLCLTAPPWFHTVTADADSLTNFVWQFRESCGDRIETVFLRGKKLQTYAGLMDEFGAALQFPYYFGENLNALYECFADLEWISAGGFLIVILDADLVLRREESGAAALLFRHLAGRVAEWNEGEPPTSTVPRQPTPFHIILQSADAQAVTAVLWEAQIDYRGLSIPASFGRR